VDVSWEVVRQGDTSPGSDLVTVSDQARLWIMDRLRNRVRLAAGHIGPNGVRVDKVATLDLGAGLLAFPDRLHVAKGELDDEGILVGLEFMEKEVFMPVSTKSAFVCRTPALVAYASYVPFVLSQGIRAVEQMVYQVWQIIPRRLEYLAWGEAWRVPSEVLREMHKKGIF
jgi:hypothetical protein